MPHPAEPHLHLVGDEVCWMVDWREYFRCRQISWDNHPFGDLPGFHVVFTVEALATGALRFWCDDGCIIRRDGCVLREDRAAHGIQPAEIAVRAGDVLEIAQWQVGWEWCWGARMAGPVELPAFFAGYLGRVLAALEGATGPPLKMYTAGASPVRAAAAIYSLILNGFAPSRVMLYGEHQWPGAARRFFAAVLPFAHVVPSRELEERVRWCGGHLLAEMARRYWFVMKACAALLHEPAESCLIDDDVFVLDRCDDALAAFARHDLVYGQDQDQTRGYLGMWGRVFGHTPPLPTARFNAGLYWMRNPPEPRWLASRAVRARPDPSVPYTWEQGLIAAAYADRPTLALPERRYLFALFTGFPGGVFGYDWARNPCGFASVHFAGMRDKPTDGATLELLPRILGRAAGVGA